MPPGCAVLTTRRDSTNSFSPDSLRKLLLRDKIAMLPDLKRALGAVIAEHLLKKALGDNPAAIAEVDRRLAAGQNPTLEEVQAIEGPGEPWK